MLTQKPTTKYLSLLEGLTYIDGIFFALMVASSESYSLFYFTQKGIGGVELAQLSTVPVLFAACMQLVIPGIVSRMHLGPGLLICMLVQILGLIGLFMCSLNGHNFGLALASLALYWIGGQNVSPLWIDFLSQRLPANYFSHFFAKRNSYIMGITMLFYVCFAYILDRNIPFSVLFAVGIFSRLISFSINLFIATKFPADENLSTSTSCANKTHEDMALEKRIFKRYFFWGGIFRFACNICSPFFIVYMIKDLDLSTPSYVWLTAVPFIGRGLFLANWNRASEGGKAFYGVQVAAIFIAILPSLWTFSSDFKYLLFLQLLSGLFWGGMELAQVLMLQHHNYGQTRKLLGIQQATFTVMATLGALMGGKLFDMNWTIPELFHFSSAMRVGAAILLLMSLRHFKLSKMDLNAGSRYLMTVLSFRPSLAHMIRIIPVRSQKYLEKK